MKTIRIIPFLLFVIVCVLFTLLPYSSYSQRQNTRQNTKQEQKTDQTPNVLDQNISIYAENESLSNVIERICNYLKLDYSYNSKLIEGKQINPLTFSTRTSAFMLKTNLFRT